jgi:hypothetical protein
MRTETAEAGEHFAPNGTPNFGPPYHHILVELRVAVINKDGINAQSIELVDCKLDIGDGKYDVLLIDREVHANAVEGDQRRRYIKPGGMLTLPIRIVKYFPISEAFTPYTEVEGTITLRDNRSAETPVSFACAIVKNPIPTF